MGYCSRRILELDPYHDALAKKIGVYAALMGVSAPARGRFLESKVKTILEFCGEEPDFKRPGEAVDRVVKAFQKLVDIALLPGIPANLIPKDRNRGYLNKWLEEVITIELNPEICQTCWERLEAQRKRLADNQKSLEDRYEADAVYEQVRDQVLVPPGKDHMNVIIAIYPLAKFRELYPGIKLRQRDAESPPIDVDLNPDNPEKSTTSAMPKLPKSLIIKGY